MDFIKLAKAVGLVLAAFLIIMLILLLILVSKGAALLLFGFCFLVFIVYSEIL